MNKADLKKNQPVAWKMLSRALKEDKVSHAYLFYGPKGSPKSQMALLMAQSLFCKNPDEDGFACQECGDCKRIEREENLDFYWMHAGGHHHKRTRKEMDAWWKNKTEKEQKPENFRIKKEGILDLQEAFSRSAIGKNQVYILENYDTATPDASNSLLKFLEEPKEGLVGILTADQLGNVLPTIQSRCQMISFRPASREALKEELRDLFDEEDSLDMLSQAGWSKDEAIKLFDENFDTIKEGAKKYYSDCHLQEAILKVQTEIFYPKSPMLTKTNMTLFYQWLLYLARNDNNDPIRALKIREVLLEALDRIRRPVDLAMLADRTMFEIWKIKNSKTD